jgi:dTDP-4-amino-4,6-dideoxygalactose transaminase
MSRYPAFSRHDYFSVADRLSARGKNLPSYPDLCKAEVELICGLIRTFMNSADTKPR